MESGVSSRAESRRGGTGPGASDGKRQLGRLSLAASGVLLVGMVGLAPPSLGAPQVIGLVELPGLFGSRDP
jgi:hypothetical protein